MPHVMLIDGNGILSFVGHPASRELENDIDKLIKGEKLTGEGTGSTAPQDDSFRDIDIE